MFLGYNANDSIGATTDQIPDQQADSQRHNQRNGGIVFHDFRGLLHRVEGAVSRAAPLAVRDLAEGARQFLQIVAHGVELVAQLRDINLLEKSARFSVPIAATRHCLLRGHKGVGVANKEMITSSESTRNGIRRSKPTRENPTSWNEPNSKAFPL